jgi:hypothetical protein
MRAFDLRTVVTHDATGYRSTPIPGALGPVWLVPRVRVAETREERWKAIGSSHWDPAVEAIVSHPVGGLVGERGAAARAAAGRYGDVRIMRDEPDEQVVEVESAGGILVASGLFFPGWQVHVDGESARPLEVDGALRGVALPPGRHQVEWRYRPTWLPAAWAATAAAVGVVITLSSIRAWRSRSA